MVQVERRKTKHLKTKTNKKTKDGNNKTFLVDWI